ncbi:hypothetical protein BRD19_12375 [Halobacteriales archaeon SW_7_65_23]|jgi:hypothetical protein|nr:MAG: hypothetical protein BRD19_12375 [Halobacteriales archaeon SW_7_65_23]
MDQLSSCYFCGTALDESLRTYRLGSSGGNVTLCQGCHEKLETVFEAADIDPGALADEPAATDDEPESVDESEEEETDQQDTDDSDGEDEAAEGAENGMDSHPVPEETDAEDILVDLEADEPTDADPSESADADGDTEGPIYLEEDDIIVAETDPDAAETAEQPEDGDSPDDDSSDESSTDTSAGTDDAGGTAGEAQAADDTDASANGEQSDGTATEETDEEESGDGPDIDQSLTKLEYNKVMRLLQNREFPVDREEFVIVAANAYGLARSECNAVIDLAIDRGLIAEDEKEGQLLRGD